MEHINAYNVVLSLHLIAHVCYLISTAELQSTTPLQTIIVDRNTGSIVDAEESADSALNSTEDMTSFCLQESPLKNAPQHSNIDQSESISNLPVDQVPTEMHDSGTFSSDGNDEHMEELHRSDYSDKKQAKEPPLQGSMPRIRVIPLDRLLANPSISQSTVHHRSNNIWQRRNFSPMSTCDTRDTRRLILYSDFNDTQPTLGNRSNQSKPQQNSRVCYLTDSNRVHVNIVNDNAIDSFLTFLRR